MAVARPVGLIARFRLISPYRPIVARSSTEQFEIRQAALDKGFYVVRRTEVKLLKEGLPVNLRVPDPMDL